MAEYFKELLNTNSTLNTEEIPAAEYDFNININGFTFKQILKTVKRRRSTH